MSLVYGIFSDELLLVASSKELFNKFNLSSEESNEGGSELDSDKTGGCIKLGSSSEADPSSEHALINGTKAKIL